jgi:DNA-binding response OmpR family regulator
MKIMIVEDESIIREELVSLFATHGYETYAVTDFSDVKEQVLKEAPSLLLLDIQLPGLNGESLLKEIRSASSLPVIMLTSRDSEIDEVLSMSYGADDYITKPYNPILLLLRVQAVLKRSYSASAPVYHDVEVNLEKGVLTRGNKEEVLTKNEMIIFHELLDHLGEIVSRDTLMTSLWNQKEYISDNALTVNISRLRKKLKDLGFEDAITTRKGMGYVLE